MLKPLTTQAQSHLHEAIEATEQMQSIMEMVALSDEDEEDEVVMDEHQY